MHNIVAGQVRQYETKAGETVFTSHESIAIALGGTLELIAEFPADMGAVTALTDPVADTDWEAWTNSDGTGTKRTGQVDVGVELQDFNEVHITIAYPVAGGSQSDTLYVTGLTVSGDLLTIATPLTVPREDAVSRQNYKPKTLSLNDTWIRSVGDMEARAQAILDVLAQPESRISIDYYVEDWADFLSIDLSDRVRAELPTIASDGFVEAITCVIPLSGVAITCTVDVSLVEGGMSMVTPPVMATAPSRPAAPSLVVDSDTRITATGVAPDDGGSPITSYDWRHRVTGSGGSGWVDRSNVTNLIQAFSGLDASTQYDFRFRATNLVGDSPYSLVVQATTEATPTNLTAPAFADDTGDAQDWTQDEAITSIWTKCQPQPAPRRLPMRLWAACLPGLASTLERG